VPTFSVRVLYLPEFHQRWEVDRYLAATGYLPEVRPPARPPTCYPHPKQSENLTCAEASGSRLWASGLYGTLCGV